MTDRPKLLIADKFLDVLVAAGIIRFEDQLTRVVIDAKVNDVVRIYVERLGDERLLDVVPTLEGVEIRGVPAA